MQNPLFKCTKNVTYHLPLQVKRGQANFKNKKELLLQEKVENILAINQWYAGHDKELTP